MSNASSSAARKARLHAAGLCEWCGKRPRVTAHNCTTCAAKIAAAHAKRREQKIATGTCVTCNAPAIEGHTLCEQHRSVQAASATRYREKRQGFRAPRMGTCAACGAGTGYGKRCYFCGNNLILYPGNAYASR